MLGGPKDDWRSVRRESARADILRAAWALVQEHGLAGLSLRDLAGRLGMRAPSLYVYFPSKDDIYDAMFAQGYREFLELDRRPGVDLADELRLRCREFVGFCLADPVRYQLLFQRTIPGFSPSPDSWQLAQEAYAAACAGLVSFGVTQRGLDMFTALTTGLVDQQISNEPGGDRWAGMVDDAAEVLLDYMTRTAKTPTKPPTKSPRSRRRP